MHRRHFLATMSAGGIALMTAEPAPAAERKTYTYKTVDKLDIQLDVHANPADKPRPVVIWIHGGALIVGNRDGVALAFSNRCSRRDSPWFPSITAWLQKPSCRISSMT
jgi:acetyl esterase/lipase